MGIVKVSVWGLGNHSKNRILPILSKTNGIELLGVCSRNIDSVKEIANHWNCYGWKNPKEMLNCSELDVVYIATPISTHFALAKQAIEAGKHVWVEKPLTCSYADTQALVALAEKNDKVLTETFMHLYHPQFQSVKNFVDSTEVHSIICRFGIPALDIPGFRNNPDLCGGAFWDVASYTVSTLLSLLPSQQVQIVFSEILTKKGLKVDNEGRALLRFSQGVTAYLEWSVGVSYKNEIDLWGVDSSFFTEKIFSKPKDYQPCYKIRDLYGNERIEYGIKTEQFMEMFDNFVEMINNKEKIIKERESILQRAKLMHDIVNY